MRNYSKVGGKNGKPGYRTPSSFRSKVLKIVKNIPAGKTMTYKQVAEKAGNPRASRAVGNIMHKNYEIEIPCHRVVRSDGTVGGYNRGTDVKRELLKNEGGKVY